MSDYKTTSQPPTYTPTHTTDPHISAASTPFAIDGGGIGTAPEAKGTYMIRHIDSGRALTLEGGRLTLKQDAGTNGGWRWECVENDDGWLGFREAVSHRYLGRNNKGGFYAEASKFDRWENFCLRPVKSGGYHLMGISWWTFRRMGIVRDSEKLIEVSNASEAARWEFIEV
ncbi:hypothetical protein F5Y04DRAFT_226064 [Hypomontagnella monticulosa]|nr:hypothetical protein F5Y04DRAFT_226064 [Hypomontagnella monticulosa]